MAVSRVVDTFDAQGNPVSRMSTTAEDTNLPLLVSRSSTALAGNTTFLAIASPTAAQVATQVKALTRQVNALIRIQLSQAETITDT